MPRDRASSRIWRLHFRTAAGARSQRAAIEALTALGVDVLDIDVDVQSGAEEVIAATVRLPAWLDVPALEPALLRIGADHVRAHPMPLRQLDDIATQAHTCHDRPWINRRPPGYL